MYHNEYTSELATTQANGRSIFQEELDACQVSWKDKMAAALVSIAEHIHVNQFHGFLQKMNITDSLILSDNYSRS